MNATPKACQSRSRQSSGCWGPVPSLRLLLSCLLILHGMGVCVVGVVAGEFVPAIEGPQARQGHSRLDTTRHSFISSIGSFLLGYVEYLNLNSTRRGSDDVPVRIRHDGSVDIYKAPVQGAGSHIRFCRIYSSCISSHVRSFLAQLTYFTCERKDKRLGEWS